MSVVAVTGITGKTGYWFYHKLCEEATSLPNYSFRFASRSQISLKPIGSASIKTESVTGDISNRAFCESLCRGADTLIHIAGIRWSLPLIEVAAECGVKRFILVHTTGMFSKYKNAAKPYVALEKRIHEIAEDNKIQVTILRPTMIYGTLNDKNVSTFIRMVDKLKFFPVINGAKYELQPVHSRDLGEAYYSVLMSPETTTGKEYNLSGGAPIMLIDMLKTISAYLGKRTHFFTVPFGVAYFGAWVLFCGTFGRFDYREKVQRMIEPRVFSHENAASDFGYSPVTFAEGVKEEVEQYLSNKG